MAGLGLDIGLKALLTSQTALDVIGHNVANASTPGYSRQTLSLSASRTVRLRGLALGTGVSGDSVSRSVDDLILRRLVAQTSSFHRLDRLRAGLSQVEALLGEPGESGLGARIDALFGGLAELSSNPGDAVLRAGVVQDATAFTDQLHQLVGGLDDLAQDSIAQITSEVERVNQIAAEIARLNQEVGELEASGVPANDLRDQREQRLRDLAELVNVQYQEAGQGAVRVTIGGRLLVGVSQAYEMTAESDPEGNVRLGIQGSDVPLEVLQGAIAGRLSVGQSLAPSLRGRLDDFARSMILEFNRAHSTGVPASGPFQSLVGEYAVTDHDGDGVRTDELLASTGLPFEIAEGRLYVSVTDLASGAVDVHALDVDPQRDTVADLIAAFDGIDGLDASLDAQGRLQLLADPGKGFDFAPRLDSAPAEAGTFGGGVASLGTPTSGTFALADGDTLDLVGPLGPFSVTFSAADFQDISRATPEEIAAVLEANTSFQAAGLRAVVEGGRLFVQTDSAGATESFDVAGGTALAALGWSPVTVTGSDTAVDVSIGGTYAGGANGSWTFVPSGDGTIGTTPGLTVEVYDGEGRLVSTLGVGEGYVPGTELEVAEGVTVSFGFGELSATDNDAFQIDLIADSDTSDVLVAFGLNSFFTGTDATNIGVRDDIVADPDLIAGSATGASGDNGILLRLVGLQEAELEDLGGRSLSGFYANLVSDVGFQANSTDNALQVEQNLIDGFERRRQEVSGVNVDEELVNMVQFEQSYQAASRFIQVVSQLQDALLSIL